MRSSPAADRLRQAFITVCFVVGIVGVLFGVGVLGTRVEESPGGDLAADATLLAPASPAFSIWSLIYLLLTAYVLWQWLPAQVSDARQRATGWLAGGSLLLNAAWLLVTQQGWIWASLIVMFALLGVLILLMFRLHTTPRESEHGAAFWAETIVVDVAFGLYLGWVLAATGANIGAALASSDLGPGSWTSIALVVIVTVSGIALLQLFDGRLSIAAALAWGLAWIAYGRLFDEPADGWVGVVAGVCALIVLAAASAQQARAQTPAPRHPLAL